jgi:hypothetical protein
MNVVGTFFSKALGLRSYAVYVFLRLRVFPTGCKIRSRDFYFFMFAPAGKIYVKSNLFKSSIT